MNFRITLGFLSFVMMLSACERSFDSPPPVPVVGVFTPGHGFASDQIEIPVTNPGAPGEMAVYFGTAKAEILSSDENGVTVKVPVLETGSSVPIQISTSGGQADSGETLFVYDGHGHPLGQRVIEERTSRVSPTVVFTLPSFSLGMFAFLNADSQHIGIMIENSGLHVEIGLCGTPMSATLGVDPESEWDPELEWKLQFWIVALQEAQEIGSSDPTRLLRMQLDSNFIISPIQVEPTPQPEGEAFVPLMIQNLCANALCTQHLMAITDLSEPRIAFAAIPTMSEAPSYTLQSIDEADLLCEVSHSRIMDLVQDLVTNDLFALPTNSPEVWRIPLGLDAPERVFPVDDENLLCARSFSALAMDPRREGMLDSLTLYVAQVSPMPMLLMLRKVDLVWRQVGKVALDGFPFAVTGGRFDDEAGTTHARIYVMTSNGLRAFDVSDDKLDPVFSLPQNVIFGGPKALITDSKYRPLLGRHPDTIVFADTTRDQLITWTVGKEAELIHHLPLGPIIPDMARSTTRPLDFLSDSLSNAIRVLDRDSAAQVALFGIDGNLATSTSNMKTVALDNMELLLIPKLNPAGPGIYKGLQIHRVDEAVALPDCQASLHDGQKDFTNTLHLFENASFDRMLYVEHPPPPRPDGVAPPRLVFIRDYDKETNKEGAIWTREVNKASPSYDANIFGPPERPDVNLPHEFKAFALDQTGSLIGVVVPTETGGDDAGYALVLKDIAKNLQMSLPISNLFAQHAVALAVVKSGSEDQPSYSAYLSIGGTGEILHLRFDSSGSFAGKTVLNVGGMPKSFSISPDSRRLYASHSAHNILSIIDIDCDSAESDCPNLQANLNVGAYPAQVIFRPDGGQALLLHYSNSLQTLIE